MVHLLAADFIWNSHRIQVGPDELVSAQVGPVPGKLAPVRCPVEDVVAVWSFPEKWTRRYNTFFTYGIAIQRRDGSRPQLFANSKDEGQVVWIREALREVLGLAPLGPGADGELMEIPTKDDSAGE